MELYLGYFSLFVRLKLVLFLFKHFPRFSVHIRSISINSTKVSSKHYNSLRLIGGYKIVKLSTFVYVSDIHEVKRLTATLYIPLSPLHPPRPSSHPEIVTVGPPQKPLKIKIAPQMTQ